MASAFILGAGPAGATTAIQLSRIGVNVTILERNNEMMSRPGELLASQTKPLLVEMGLLDACESEHRSTPGIVSTWGESGAYESDFLFDPYGDALLIDRKVFDRQLVDKAIAKGVVVITGWRLRSVEQVGKRNLWQIIIERAGESRAMLFDWVIDASGRNSWLSRCLGVTRVEFDKLIGIVGFLNQPLDADSRLSLEAVENGWWYYANLPNQRAVAVFMTDSDLYSRSSRVYEDTWHEQLTHTQRGQSIRPNWLEEIRVVKANSSRLSHFGGEKWLAVGDAAAAWDPLSSHGLTNAIESGFRAANVISSESATLELYTSWLEALWSGYRESHAYYYSRVTRWPDSIFWCRRNSAEEALKSRLKKSSNFEHFN